MSKRRRPSPKARSPALVAEGSRVPSASAPETPGAPRTREARGEELRLARWLWVALTGVYLATASGYLENPDAVRMFQVTEAMVERGTFAVEPFKGWEDFGGAFAVDPRTGERRFYSWFGLGPSLAAVPTYLLGRVLSAWAGDAERDLFSVGEGGLGRPALEMGVSPDPQAPPQPIVVHRLWYDTSRAAFARAFAAFAVSWTNAWVAALVGVFLFLTCRELGHSTAAALTVALVACLASPLLHYARTFFSEPLSALGLSGFLYAAVRGRAPGAERWWAVAGLLFGVAVLAKVTHLVLVLPGGLLLLEGARRKPPRAAVQGLLGAAGGLAVSLAVVAWYNQMRFGSPLRTGLESELGRWDTPLFEGLAGLLVSPGRGLFLYFPLTALCLWAAWRGWRRGWREWGFGLACLALLVLVHARWFMWEGGWCWGPRFLVPAVPLLCLPLASLVDGFRALQPWARAASLALAAVSTLVAWSGTWVNFVHFELWVQYSFLTDQAAFVARGVRNYYDLIRWSWEHSPLLRYWSFGVHDYYLFPYALRLPGLTLGLLTSFAVAAVVGAARLWTGFAPRIARRESRNV